MKRILFTLAFGGALLGAHAATLHNAGSGSGVGYATELANQPNYPKQSFFIGVGVSPISQADADNQAMVQIQKQITVTIKSTQESGMASKREGGKEETRRWLESRSTLNTRGDIQGADIILRNSKDKSFYSVAALDKAKFSASKRMNMDEAAKSIRTLAEAAKADADANRLADALSSRSRIEERMRYYQSERLLLSAAQQLLPGDTVPVNMDALQKVFEAALKKLNVEAISGADQSLVDPAQAMMPWVVKVSALDQPVAEMPLKLISPDRKVVRTAITDAQGQAVFYPDAFIGRAAGEQTWKVMADLQVTRSQVDLLERKRANFRVTVTPVECKVKYSMNNLDAKSRKQLETTLANYGFRQDPAAKRTLSASIMVEQKGYSQGLSEQTTFTMQEVALSLKVTDPAGRSLHETQSKASGTGNKEAAISMALGKMQLGPDASKLSKAACGDGSPAKPLPTLAIMPFSAPRYWYSDEARASLLADMVAGAIYRFEGYQIVERTRLNDVLAEQATGQTGMIADPVEMGQLIGAQYMLVGTLLGDWDHIRVEGRLLDTKTGAVVKTFSASGSLESIAEQIAKQTL